MKILLINTLYSPNQIGGAEKSVQLLSEELVNLNHDVSVITLDKRENFQVINGVKVYYLKNKNIYWPFNYNKKRHLLEKIIWHIIDTYFCFHQNKILKILDKEKPEIIHTNNLSGISTNIVKIINKRRNIPIVHTLRDYHLLCYKNTLFNGGSNCESLCSSCKVLSKRKTNNIGENASAVIGISNFILEEHFQRGLKRIKNHLIIYNPINNKIKEIQKPKNSTVTFGFIGTLSKAKGLEKLLEDFNSEKIKDLNWTLKIAGKGDKEYINYLKRKYGNLKIEFLGFVDASSFYNNIDALIVPSLWHEPFGRVVIEATQANIPVFVSNNGGLSELENKIETVIRYSQKNIESFILNPTKLVFKSCLDDFNNQHITNQYLKLYNRIIDPKK